ncbi:hypothetical protein COO91_03913 [Nostoc flagelliforme CCNUN1]|uniref:Uncharacterized protein n=1 Tax=Nostoc flagelliforme CCNUN1 TaxID=2038116 RepID=A0A2K8SRB6_9NOSO|nr:hypothetical protein COO91_03913 [Nostoc flagelliforme CCNUN1]
MKIGIKLININPVMASTKTIVFDVDTGKIYFLQKSVKDYLYPRHFSPG